MPNITTQQLIEILSQPRQNAVFCSFDSVTEPKMTKTLVGTEGYTRADRNPHYGRVLKESKNNFIMLLTNADAYKKMVNKRLKAEAERTGGKYKEFETAQNWHTPIEGTPLLRKRNDDGSRYLKAIFAQKPENLLEAAKQMGLPVDAEDVAVLRGVNTGNYGNISGPNVSYLLDGRKVAKAEIFGLSKSERGGEQGGLHEKAKVIYRTFKVQNITAVRIDGETYTVIR